MSSFEAEEPSAQLEKDPEVTRCNPFVRDVHSKINGYISTLVAQEVQPTNQMYTRDWRLALQWSYQLNFVGSILVPSLASILPMDRAQESHRLDRAEVYGHAAQGRDPRSRGVILAGHSRAKEDSHRPNDISEWRIQVAATGDPGTRDYALQVHGWRISFDKIWEACDQIPPDHPHYDQIIAELQNERHRMEHELDKDGIPVAAQAKVRIAVPGGAVPSTRKCRQIGAYLQVAEEALATYFDSEGKHILDK